MNFSSLLIAIVLAAAPAAAADTPPTWNLQTFQNESTLQFYTMNSAGDGHWSTVWVVVIDGAPYLRLGTQSVSRIDGNVSAPYVNIRIAGQEFDHVMAQSAPEMRDKIQAAMADKYWLDFLVRHSDHPMVVRLVAAPAPPAH
jgi:hypothetical protein